LNTDGWKQILDSALASFASDELAIHALRTKPEGRLRNALANSLSEHLRRNVICEYPTNPGRVDMVAQRSDGTPSIWVELKTGYTFDAVCSGGPILLAGKSGRSHSVASDVAKLQRAASGQAYVMYASVHPEGELPSWACGGDGLVEDYYKKHASALRRFGSAAQLIPRVDRMCEHFGRTGQVDGYQAVDGIFPLRHVLTHQARIGKALGVSVSLRTWVWEVPLR
jgi:hypothetical protein